MVVLASCSMPSSADTPPNAPFTVTEAGTFEEPWALAFIPGTPYALVTEKAGTLKLWREGGQAVTVTVAGTPKVAYAGQGGFGDVKPAPDFAQTGTVYLSWAEAGAGATRGAAVGKAKLVLGDAPRLEGLQVIWRQSAKVTGGGH